MGRRTITVILFLAPFLVLAAATTAAAGESNLIAVDANHVAIKGYDTVAYFTDGQAIKGSSEFEYAWSDARWQFSSATHRDMFAANPERYAPQYGGYCAGLMASYGALSIANPKTWTIVDGKLYMFSGADVGDWRANDIARGDANWHSAHAWVIPSP
jgi:hypothetical protein